MSNVVITQGLRINACRGRFRGNIKIDIEEGASEDVKLIEINHNIKFVDFVTLIINPRISKQQRIS
jgi:hypothetical protein